LWAAEVMILGHPVPRRRRRSAKRRKTPAKSVECIVIIDE